ARRAQEDIAKANLLQAHQAAARAARAAHQSKAHYQAAAAASNAEFRLHRAMWELAAQGVTNAQKAEEQARQDVNRATEEYLECSRAVSVIEHLDQVRRLDHAAEVQREEADLVDELVTAKHVKEQSQRRRANPGAGEEAGRWGQ